MSLVKIDFLQEKFDCPDVLAILEDNGVRPVRINAFDRSQDEYELETAAQAVMAYLDDEEDDEKAAAIEELRQRANELRAERNQYWGGMAKVVEDQGDYSGMARFADPSGGGVVFE